MKLKDLISVINNDRFLEFLRYTAISAVALLIDVGLLFLLHHHFMVNYILAGSISFLTGMAIVYVGSILWVFSVRAVSKKTTEISIFFIVGILGLLLNDLLLFIFVTIIALPVMYAKLGTIGFVFLFNFFGRKFLLFYKKTPIRG